MSLTKLVNYHPRLMHMRIVESMNLLFDSGREKGCLAGTVVKAYPNMQTWGLEHVPTEFYLFTILVKTLRAYTPSHDHYAKYILSVQ